VCGALSVLEVYTYIYIYIYIYINICIYSERERDMWRRAVWRIDSA